MPTCTISTREIVQQRIATYDFSSASHLENRSARGAQIEIEP